MKKIFLFALLVSALFFSFERFSEAQTRIAQSKMNKDSVSRKTIKYPTMLDMTFPEFEAAAAKTDIALLPIGAIEEHGSHLPLGTDAIGTTAQVFYVQKYLRDARVETIIAPP
jgi:hypothetical protein